ncbi:MAG: hypothetical protein U5R31_10775 [Acidimicrobiia bacterium]|nr:hypothetical protein [Acidimicrobiia bacterium]
MTASTHRMSCAEHEVGGCGSDEGVTEEGSLVRLDQPGAPVGGVTALLGALHRRALHRRGNLDVEEVEHRRGDVDGLDETGAPGGPRGQEAGLGAGGPETDDGEVDPGALGIGRHHHDRVPLRIDLLEETAEQLVAATQRVLLQLGLLVVRGERPEVLVADEVGRLDQHDVLFAVLPGGAERTAHRVVVVAGSVGRRGVRLQ